MGDMRAGLFVKTTVVLPQSPAHWNIANRSPLVHGARLDLTLVLLTNALYRVGFFRRA
jgi:hypothetical protein